MPINSVETKTGNPWGGLIYIRIPKYSEYGMFSVTIENAVRAPYYVLGKTSEEEWKKHN